MSSGKQYSLHDLMKDLRFLGFILELVGGYFAWALSRKTPQSKVPALLAPALVVAGLGWLLFA